MTVIEEEIYSRAGLVGNPSDGFNGKTIAFSIKNFSAKVTLWESPELEVILSQQDLCRFKNRKEHRKHKIDYGYHGGLVLLEAAIKRFTDYVEERGIIPQRKGFDKNFTVKYDTNIPRQVGLAGSSAIVTAIYKAQMKFHGVSIDPAILANLVLSTEKDELGIQAGLQDRVVQAYGGMVYMDFSEEAFERNNSEFGFYEQMNPGLLPNMFLVHDVPSQSGQVHRRIKDRYDKGDKEVIKAMETFANLTVQAKRALEARDYATLSDLMNQNFDKRLELYGADTIGKRNLDMIEIARKHCGCAKFSGSGGAVIGIYESEEQFSSLEKAFKDKGYTIIKVNAK